jgi:hypothetical protein
LRNENAASAHLLEPECDRAQTLSAERVGGLMRGERCSAWNVRYTPSSACVPLAAAIDSYACRNVTPSVSDWLSMSHCSHAEHDQAA